MSGPVWPDGEGGLLAGVVGHYRRALAGSVEAQGWLERRRIADVDVLGRLGVGFSDRTLGRSLPGGQVGREVRDRLRSVGVLRGSGHEQFRGCVTFPVFDESGEVVQVYGRTLLDDDRLAAGRHRWLPGARRGVWNWAGIVAGGGDVVLCEGVVDAVTLVCAGFEWVTATDGPGGFDDELETALLEAGVERVVVAFDADPDGDAGAREVAARLGRVGVSVARAVLPAGLDVNEVAVRAKQPSDALAGLVRRAVWVDTTPPPRRAGSGSTSPAAAATVSEPESRPLSAEPAAESPSSEPVGGPVSSVDGELRLGWGGRRWRVRGLSRVSSFEVLKLNVLVGCGDRFHVDSFDLYQAKQRAGFVAAAAGEVGVDEVVLKGDLGRVLLACEGEVERLVHEAQAPTQPLVELSEQERVEALELLRDPGLVDRIVADVGRVGIVGETSNALVAYLAAVSRKLDNPLAVVVQSTSAAGKSALVDAVLGFVPDEDLVRYSAVTGQSLFYMGGGDLAHKVLAVAEEEGASRASYALKLLQSDGRLSIASTGKDGMSGRLTTHTYEVTGPTAIFLTTTAIDIDEELLNRCLVLTVDESVGQTRAIHAKQRTGETLAGLVGSTGRDGVVAQHRNAQRLLDEVAVVNPFAEQLTFADGSTRTRRDHAKYLSLIRAVTFMHQYQRTRRTVIVDDVEVVYIESTVDDVAVANRIAHDILGRSLDELPPQTRRLLEELHEHVTTLAGEAGVEDVGELRVSRRQVREALGWGDTQLKVHLARLVDLELLVAHRGENGALLYELAWDGQGTDGSRFVIGLTDPDTLTSDGFDGDRSGPSRPLVGARSGGGRNGDSGVLSQLNDHKQPSLLEDPENHLWQQDGSRHVIPADGVSRVGVG